MLAKRIIALALPFIFLGCQSMNNGNQTGSRGVASLFDQMTDEEAQELDGKFQKVFDDLLEKYKADSSSNKENFASSLQGHEVDPFNRVAILILKRSFYYLGLLDRALVNIHRECQALLNNGTRGNDPIGAQCRSIMDDPNYSKLWASRIINEKNQRQLWYYYIRMLDIANATQGEDPGLSSTKEVMDGADFSTKNLMASKMIEIWNENLDSYLEGTRELENPANFDLVKDVFELREDAIETWSEIKGKSYTQKTLIDAFPDFVQKYQTDEIIQQMYTNNNVLNESAEDQAAIAEENFDDIAEAIANDIEESKRQPNAISKFHNHTGRNFARGEWVLTYDDGPGGSRTKTIVDTLKNAGWHATFFMLAKNAKADPNTVKYVLDNGMAVASHSYTHADLNKANSSTLDKEITTAKEVLEQVYASVGYSIPVNYFRAPYGAGLKKSGVQNRVVNAGMEHFYWNVDTLDWKSSTPDQVYTRTKQQMDTQGRGIILFHDIHQRTVETTKLMVSRLRGSVNFVPLDTNRSGIQQTANGGSPSSGGGGNTGNPPPANQFPKRVIITATTYLNIRTEPTSRGGKSTICGEFLAGESATVSGISAQDRAWFTVNPAQNSIRTSRETNRNNCSGEVYIHGGYTR